jgi:hypothetical protein
MNDTSRKRQIDLTVTAITVVAVLWAVWHIWSVLANPWDEPQSAWMIWPLVIGLCISAPFVLYTATGARGAKLAPDSPGLGDPGRLRFVLCAGAMVAGIWLIGLLAAAIVGPPAMAFVMGERNPGRIVLTATLPVVILMGLFVWALGVRQPLGPGWM